MQYRPDIDGLRAVSVASVVLFHADLAAFSGGFVGVDVFFVISGFLITSIIRAQLAAGTFTIGKFYEGRVRRLFPALAAVLITTFLICLAIFTPIEFIAFSKSLIATLFFSSNWFFLSEAGYFDAPSLTKPLLHTWTLSIEEQFYVVFPLLLILFSRVRGLRVFVILAFLSSFALSEYFILSGMESQAFFNSLARFWELLIGCGLAIGLYRLPDYGMVHRAARIMGLGLILFAVFLFSSNTPFPGFYGLFPTIGAVLMLAASPKYRDPVSILLSSRPVVYIGLISYSLYLWHWPIFVAESMYVLNGSIWSKAVCIALAVGLSALSYRYLETPIRKRRLFPTRPRVFAATGVAFSLVLATGFSGYAAHGFPSRLGTYYEMARAGRHDHNPDRRYCYDLSVQQIERDNICIFGHLDRDQFDFAMFGDSHSDAWLPAFRKMADEHGLKGAYAGLGGCPPLVGLDRLGNSRCSAFTNAMFDYVKRHGIKDVYLVDRWGLYPLGWPPRSTEHRSGHLEPYLRPAGSGITMQTKEGSKRVFHDAALKTAQAFPDLNIHILGQIPPQPDWVPAVMARDALLGRDSSSFWTTRTAYLKRQSFIIETFKEAGFDYIDVTGTFCPEETCIVAQDGMPLYIDDDHPNMTGALFASSVLGPSFAALADRVGAKPPSPEFIERQRNYAEAVEQMQADKAAWQNLVPYYKPRLEQFREAKKEGNTETAKTLLAEIRSSGYYEALKAYRASLEQVKALAVETSIHYPKGG